MIFTDLPREELLEADCPRRKRRSATELLQRKQSAPVPLARAERRMRQFMEKVRAASRQLQNAAIAVWNRLGKRRWRMNDKQPSNGTFDPAMFRKGTNAKPAEDGALLPALNDPYKAGGFVDSEVSRLVLVMGKDGFGSGTPPISSFSTCIWARANSASRPTGRYSASSSPTFSQSWSRCMAATCNGFSITSACSGCRGFARRTGISGDRWPTDNEPFISRIEVADWKRKADQAENLTEALDLHQA